MTLLEHIKGFIERSEFLHKSVDALLSTPSPEVLRDASKDRRAHLTDLKKLKRSMDRKIREIQDLKADIQDAIDVTSNDVKDLDQGKIDYYSERKNA